MEHLPRISNARYDFEVPYLCTEPYPYMYDSLDFHTFPTRKGWDLKRLFNGQLQGSTHETCAMLQAWLFFGMLTEVMDIPINPDDFRRVNDRGRLVITTALLHNYLHTWAASTMREDFDRAASFHRALRCLQGVAHWVHRLPENQDSLPLPGEVTMSIGLVAEMLTLFGSTKIWQIGSVHISERLLSASFAYRSGLIMPGFSGESLAHSRFVREHTLHWCPSERSRLTKTLMATPVLFLTRMRLPQSNKSHKDCTEEECVEYNIRDSEYEVKYHPGCPGCDMVGPDEKELGSIVHGGGLPLIKVSTSSDGDCTLELISGKQDTRFTAISHVWSDGLGNPRSNQLPKCQLRQIAGHLTKPAINKSRPIFEDYNFDQDDIEYLVDRRPRSCPDRGQFLERLAELREASKKTFLNSATNIIKRIEQDSEEVIFGSERPEFDGWSSDWGKHFKRKNPVQTASDEVANAGPPNPPRVASFESAVDRGIDASNTFWMDTLCIPVEKTGRRKAVSEMNDVYKAADRVLIIDSSLSGVSSADKMEFILCRLMLSGWMRRLWTYPEGVLAKAKHFLLADGLLDFDSFSRASTVWTKVDSITDMISRIIPHRPLGLAPTQCLRLFQLLRDGHLAQRSMSKKGDEALALGLLLDYTPEQKRLILDTPDEERMAQFWTILREVPRGLVFWSGPRLTKFPYRWAPSTLRHFRIRYLEAAPFAPGIMTPQGLKAKFPAFVFTTQGGMDQGFLLWDHDERVLYDVRRSPQAASGDSWVSESKTRPLRYAVITVARPQEVRDVQGVLVFVYKEDSGVYYTRFNNNVRIRRLNDDEAAAFSTYGGSVWDGLRSRVFATARTHPDPTWVVG